MSYLDIHIERLSKRLTCDRRGFGSIKIPAKKSKAAFLIALLALLVFGVPLPVMSQTVSTGAVTGLTVDSTGAIVPRATISLTEDGTSIAQSVMSDKAGTFAFTFLTPGAYWIHAESPDRRLVAKARITVSVTETARLELFLQVNTVRQQTEVVANGTLTETESPVLGRVADETAVTNLPLVSRNFTQIVGLSPGVSTGVSNAGELGLGGNGFSQIDKSNDGMFVHGTRSYENNFQTDGISVSDIQGSGTASGGTPIPNPDAIQEFKVQTGLYDAAYGRYAGANVAIITKSGSNAFHGSAFEFFRDDFLNANDFFFDQTGQGRPELEQNQFGADLGGPVEKDKVLFFVSYQGTRQLNGLAAGQARTGCTVSLITPPLTDDRSAVALGNLFGGMAGALGGEPIAADGSNINPVALALLNLKLPNGAYLIPTPETVNSGRPFNSEGFSTFSHTCHFSEEQFLGNADYLSSENRLSARFFWANNKQLVTFPGNGFNKSTNLDGFPSNVGNQFTVLSIAHTLAASPRSLNQLRAAFVHIVGSTTADSPFSWSDIGVNSGTYDNENALPTLNIAGSISFGSGFPRTFSQNSYWLVDDFSTVRGRNSVRAGGSLTRLQDDVHVVGVGSFLQFMSWPDFLLGLSSSQNGSLFSNVFFSGDSYGLFDRKYRSWEYSAYAQDDYHFRNSLTLNFGLRFEHLGQLSDDLGRNASFDIGKADPDPPADGSVAGYIVASNFAGSLPAGVTRATNSFGNDGLGQNAIAPRFGFSWQILPQSKVVVRGGYGLYFSRPTGQSFYIGVFGAPFAEGRSRSGITNGTASFGNPFVQPFPTPDDFPHFPSYSPTSVTSVASLSPRFRSAVIQQFGVNVQSEIQPDLLLEIGYVGTRGTSLMRTRTLNQALNASPDYPVRDVTADTLANIQMRVPILGISADSLKITESEGGSWYNGLEASLTKRLSRGLHFLASYTFSKVLDTDGSDINSISAGNQYPRGNQDSPHQRYGRTSFDRTHRFVFSTTYQLPGPGGGWARLVLGNWSLAGVAVIQSGSALTVAYTNPTNVFGISQDRAQLTGCPSNGLVTRGRTESKLDHYFQALCFTTPPVIGADGQGTAFGNSATGLLDGPGQMNLDVSLAKAIPVSWPVENSTMELRVGFFNALNHAQFANPDNDLASPTFGVISSTAVNPRVGQLAVKLVF